MGLAQQASSARARIPRTRKYRRATPSGLVGRPNGSATWRAPRALEQEEGRSTDIRMLAAEAELMLRVASVTGVAAETLDAAAVRAFGSARTAALVARPPLLGQPQQPTPPTIVTKALAALELQVPRMMTGASGKPLARLRSCMYSCRGATRASSPSVHRRRVTWRGPPSHASEAV